LEDSANSLLRSAFRNFVAVDDKRSRSALAIGVAVVHELGADLVQPRG
jgi:hypothetical protein